MSANISSLPSGPARITRQDSGKSLYSCHIDTKSTLLESLRSQIARIEEKPATWFRDGTGDAGAKPKGAGQSAASPGHGPEEPGTGEDDFPSSGPVSGMGRVRQDRRCTPHEAISLGDAAVDAALGGGFPAGGLAELHGDEARDGGSLAGFAMALAARFGASRDRPVLWISERPAIHEAGLPYPLGFAAFSVPSGAMTLVCARRLDDAIWAAEEAAACKALALVVLEARGNPRQLGLEGTRRLHVRAHKAGVPLLLVRQSAEAQSTAAPLRLRIGPAQARPVADLADQRRLVGAPVFPLSIEKNRSARTGRIDLVWSSHDRSFRLAAWPHAGSLPGARHAEASDRPDHPRPAGAHLAFRRAG
ncbi:hypothetical protein U0C82_08060 [Fulvimarina sp. 2208YS6-2-32]|uniref:Protein ImuA n=1 Tax=Fulvimarina uroteuthidis TaxID=3098149 RepID=A0ABU5I293_9HYPH|nr:hypothetical protein [Fulvimarina sp. 2208YS6-2-32]MDY8109098.1 hypothetical protein [Fulvimarina sp. 2208YS6-2-32]